MQRYALKLVLVGDSRVGKSQLSRAFVNKNFLDDAQVTVGIEFSTKVIEFEKSLIQTHIWDTAGQERMQSMTKAFFRNTAGAILVYDVCNKKSFENLQSVWLKQLRDQGYSDVRLILVGNKVDLVSPSRPREVSIEEATEFARRENMDFMETSALTNYFVEDMFRRISLSVARALPEVAVHLEVSYLPDGWMACPVDEGDESDSASAISVSDVSAALMNNIPIDSSSPSSGSGQKGNLGAALAQKTRSPLAAEVEELSKKEKYLNYWTGECVCERPTVAASLSLGLLYRAHEAPALEIDPLTGKLLDRAGMLKERTSSCKTTATFVSNSTNGGRDSCLEPNFDLHESRRSRSQGSSMTSDGSGKGGVALSRCFRCVCTIS